MRRFVRDSLRFEVKEFDLIKEGFIGLVVVAVLVLIASGIWRAPYRPAVTNQQIAVQDPVVLAQTAVGDLNGSGAIASYGPPYNNGWNGNAQSVQSLFGFHPQTWWGTPYYINTAQADVIQPLSMLAAASGNQVLQRAIETYVSAPVTEQQTWDQNLQNALTTARVANGKLVLKSGNFGPVALMITDELQLARSGLLSGALDRENNRGVYRWNVQNDLLFLQGTALHKIANATDMSGAQWGISHDEAALPGPWWLTPYTFLYQIPPWSTSSAGDEMAAFTVGLLFLLLILTPWIPGLNRLPRLLRVHRVIWRDWYKRLEMNRVCESCPLAGDCSREFKGAKVLHDSDEKGPRCYGNIIS